MWIVERSWRWRAVALDGSLRRRRQGLARTSLRALRSAFLLTVWTYRGSASRGTHLGWSCETAGTGKYLTTLAWPSWALTVVSGSSYTPWASRSGSNNPSRPPRATCWLQWLWETADQWNHNSPRVLGFGIKRAEIWAIWPSIYRGFGLISKRIWSQSYFASSIRLDYALVGINRVTPRSEKEGMKPPYVCPGCSNHTYSNNMITRIHVQ
jgi:hypothetical protein